MSPSPTVGVQIREYGTSGPFLIVIHGGPGAPGYMAPLARALADRFRVLEPLQRRGGDTPLTVARHVADLDAVVSRCADGRPALVGHSWGAMLALAYAAEHADRIASAVLIGCGTFDRASRDRLQATRATRMDGPLRERLARLPEEIQDPDERLTVHAELMLPVDSCELVVSALEGERGDARGHRETWDDMLRLQAEGVYPAAFAAIDVPVLMMHGIVDPHPGRLIRASLEPYLPSMEYREWERCGHYPWLEDAVRERFVAVLRDWLAQQF